MLKQVPLSMSCHAPETTIARDENCTPIKWEEFSARVRKWQSRLKKENELHIAIYHSDAIEFLALLHAIWLVKKIPLIPGNTTTGMLSTLTQKTSCFIGEIELPENTPDLSNKQTAKPVKEKNNDIALIIFTSGSSGKPTAVTKSFSQLNAELALLESTFGNDINNSLVIGAVSHHHMYGLPFKLLWPAVTGRLFFTKEISHLEEITKIQSTPVSLILSPLHLKHLPIPFHQQPPDCKLQTVFSAGAPLQQETAQKFEHYMSTKVIEIFGSTETGVIAHRQPSRKLYWQTFVDISIKQQNGRLALQSPLLATTDWFLTEDLCEINNNGYFTLLGRSDNLVKIAGKRISLLEIENLLTCNELVYAAKAIQLPERKSRIGVILQLTSQGNAKLIDRGKKSFVHELLTPIKKLLEPAALPRYWRFVSKIPVNQQGKTIKATLESFFSPKQRPVQPVIIDTNRNAANTSIELRLTAPSNLLYFEGHFHGTPILPGVVMLDWVIKLAQKFFNIPGNFRRLEAIKFQNVITPEIEFTLNLGFEPNKEKVHYVYNNQGTNFASGRVIFSSK